MSNPKQHEAKRLLLKHYDCILKLDAIKFLRKYYNSNELSLRQLLDVYNSIGEYK